MTTRSEKLCARCKHSEAEHSKSHEACALCHCPGFRREREAKTSFYFCQRCGELFEYRGLLATIFTAVAIERHVTKAGNVCAEPAVLFEKTKMQMRPYPLPPFFLTRPE